MSKFRLWAPLNAKTCHIWILDTQCLAVSFYTVGLQYLTWTNTFLNLTIKYINLRTDVTLSSFPACATLCHHFVCSSLELTHGIIFNHDVVCGVAAQNFFEDESCWDDWPDVFTWFIFQLNMGFWDVTPMSGEWKIMCVMVLSLVCLK